MPVKEAHRKTFLKDVNDMKEALSRSIKTLETPRSDRGHQQSQVADEMGFTQLLRILRGHCESFLRQHEE